MATPEMQPFETAAPTRFSGWLRDAKRISDLGIALPVLLYTCGFVVLGCYSEEYNLGLQAFPTVQFFSAGAGFLLIFSSIVLLALALRQLLTRWFIWLQKDTRASKFVRKAAGIMTLVAIAAFALAEELHFERVSLVAMVSITVSFFFSAERWSQKLTKFYLYCFAFLFCIAILTWYAFNAYPSIPASFGGGKPRHAHIQVSSQAIPTELAPELLAPGKTSQTGISELEGDVYLITDTSILLRVGRPAQSKTSMVLQLRRSDVNAIFWQSGHE